MPSSRTPAHRVRIDPAVHLAFGRPSLTWSHGALAVDWPRRTTRVVVPSKDDVTTRAQTVSSALDALRQFPLADPSDPALLEQILDVLDVDPDGSMRGIRTRPGVRVMVDLLPGVLATGSPDPSMILLLRSHVWEVLGDVSRSIDELSTSPITAHVALRLCHLLDRSDRSDEIVELTDGLTTLDDSTALLCVVRAVACSRLGADSDAMAAFREALRLPRTHRRVRERAVLERAALHIGHGHLGRASADLRRLSAGDADIDGLRAVRTAVSRLR